MKKVPEGRFGFCNDTHVAYDKAIMPGCVEEYSFASHSFRGERGGGVPCIVPGYLRGVGCSPVKTRSPSGIWGFGHIELGTYTFSTPRIGLDV